MLNDMTFEQRCRLWSWLATHSRRVRRKWVAHHAAKKAWRTIRANKRRKEQEGK
jgi:hypothetical protein